MEQFKKDNQVLPLDRIVIFHEDGSYTQNITKETAIANGWKPYIDEETDALINYAEPIINEAVGLDNNTALSMKHFFREWNWYKQKSISLKVGQIVKYNDELWRVRQVIPTLIEGQEPSINTAALYEYVELEHQGTIDDLIPYKPPMKIFKDKYYIQDEILYICIRDSENPLTHNLSEVIGHYVEIV